LTNIEASKGWGFESLRARPAHRPVPSTEPASFVPSDLWSRACGRLGQVSRGAGKARAVGVIVDVAGDGR
jgi:hypothetical protein